MKITKASAKRYEITAESGSYTFHNIAPSVEVAVRYLKDRFGSDVKIRIK